MRKLLLALALVPAMSQAALVIEDGAAQRPVPPVPSIKVVSASTRAIPPKSAQTIAAQIVPAPDTQLIAPNTQDVAAGQRIDVAPMWAINPSDGTLQKLFVRWGKYAGWQTIWEVDQDIPLVATAQFNGSFTDAVQQVLRTTESTDTPAHPCFYTNNVMRVVPIATVCDADKD